MPTLLHLDSSADLNHSRSRALTAAFARSWTAASPQNVVVHRDLHRDQLPHLADSEQHWAPALRAEDADIPSGAETIQGQVLADLMAADVVLIGVPTYNYSMPSTLKAWLDCIHVPGVTTSEPGAEPGEEGAGPLAGRQAVLISTSGATYDVGTPSESWNHAVPPLQIVLGNSLGMHVSLVSCTRTLADRVADMADQRDRADDEFEAARQRAVELGDQLGRA